MLSASSSLGDNSVYIFISLRLHSGDFRTDWACDGESQAVSITRASQSSEGKLKTKSKANPQKSQGKLHMCFFIIS